MHPFCSLSKLVSCVLRLAEGYLQIRLFLQNNLIFTSPWPLLLAGVGWWRSEGPADPGGGRPQDCLPGQSHVVGVHHVSIVTIKHELLKKFWTMLIWLRFHQLSYTLDIFWHTTLIRVLIRVKTWIWMLHLDPYLVVRNL